MKFRPLRALAFAVLGFGLAGAAAASGTGVVIEDVGRGSSLERAGLRSGDLVLSWERSPDLRGEIRTVFDWSWIGTEQAPRGTVRLHGERSGVATVFTVPKGLWDARVRPSLTADLLRSYMEGRRRIESGDLKGGVALWNQLVEHVEPQAEPDLRPWLLLQISEAWSRGGQGDRARSPLQAALADARNAVTRVLLAEALGESYQYANEMARAEASFRSALEAGEAAWGESLQVAGTLTRLGNILRLQYRLDEATQLQRRALAIRERWAPDSLEVADSLNQLALVLWQRGDLEPMAEQIRRALTLQEHLREQGPSDTLVMADTLSTQSLLLGERGRYAEAAAALLRALEIFEQRSPGSLAMATSLGRLATMMRMLGDVESTVELLHRALEIREKLAAESLGAAAVLNGLGIIAQERGDLAAAWELCQRALAIWGKSTPESNGMVRSLNCLGTTARLRGDLEEAWSFHSRALAIDRPDARSVTLGNLGQVAEARGDLAQALALHQQALEIHERTPGQIWMPMTLQEIGRLYRRMHRLDEAARHFARAIDVLESQVGRSGGSQETQATFRASHEEIYRDAIEVELERGQAAEAFHLVERSRARSFLTLLSERDLAFSGDLPEALERSRRENAARYDQTLRELERWSPAAGEAAREALQGELSRLRRERDEIAAEIRKASPRLAALRQPQPLDLAGARQALDAGTLSLSYSVGKEQTSLFAVTRDGGLRVEILPVGEERLRGDMERFLGRIQAQEPARDLAGSLYRALIGPVADLVEESERVLILPDGPLHRLPFGALLRDAAGEPGPGSEQYLAEWKPLHSALSLTVYGTLRGSGKDAPPSARSGRSMRLVAFGDPRYARKLAPGGEPRGPVRRDAVLRGLRGFNWEALPYTRREVERIAEVYPDARLYLGEEATEERVKAVAREARVLHFATHGLLDDRTPLDSALVLTIPEDLPAGRDNGLLQVWEIFESVRLIDADLVVLSACDSALGRELSGEGLIGLTRAFQYAGARSVVATLWSVADQVTAELMARFHRHLAAGLSKDEALRAAQSELIREPIRITAANGQVLEMDASAPFFWASFQIFGEWR